MLACAATVFAQVSTVTPVAGSSGQPGGLDGVGSAARFDYPQSVWSDGTYIYVADTGNDAIRRITIATGAVTTIAGSVGVTGAVDATGTAARFRGPEGIWGDGTNLYVADYGNHSIRRIVLSSGAVTTIAGLAATPAGTRVAREVFSGNLTTSSERSTQRSGTYYADRYIFTLSTSATVRIELGS